MAVAGAGAGAVAVAMDLRALRAALAADLPLFAVEGSHLPRTIVFPYEDRDSTQSLQARRLVSLLETAVWHDDCETARELIDVNVESSGARIPGTYFCVPLDCLVSAARAPRNSRMLRELMRDPTLEPSTLIRLANDFNDRVAFVHGLDMSMFKEVLQTIFTDERVWARAECARISEIDVQSEMTRACRRNMPDIIHTCLQCLGDRCLEQGLAHLGPKHHWAQNVGMACLNGSAEVLAFLLERDLVLTSRATECERRAWNVSDLVMQTVRNSSKSCSGRHVKLVRCVKMLLQSGACTDLPVVANKHFLQAVRSRHVCAVRVFLSPMFSSSVDPTSHASLAAWTACKNNDTSMMRELLQDARVVAALTKNPDVWTHMLVRAARRGKDAMVAVLLTVPNDPSAATTKSMPECYGGTPAIKNGSFSQLGKIANPPYNGQTLPRNEALRYACRGSYATVVALILRDARVVPSQEMVETARVKGHVSTLRLLRCWAEARKHA